MPPTSVLRTSADEIIANISQMPDRDKPAICTGKETFSVDDLIRDLRELTPRGIEFVKLHIRAKETLARLKKEQRERRIKQGTISALVLGLAVLIFTPYAPARVMGALVAFFAGIMLLHAEK